MLEKFIQENRKYLSNYFIEGLEYKRNGKILFVEYYEIDSTIIWVYRIQKEKIKTIEWFDFYEKSEIKKFKKKYQEIYSNATSLQL